MGGGATLEQMCVYLQLVLILSWYSISASNGGEELTHSRWDSVQIVWLKACGGNERQAERRAWGVIKRERWTSVRLYPAQVERKVGRARLQSLLYKASCTKPPRALGCWPKAPFIQKNGCLFSEHVVCPARDAPGLLVCSGVIIVLRRCLSLVTEQYVPGSVYTSPHHFSQ